MKKAWRGWQGAGLVWALSAAGVLAAGRVQAADGAPVSTPPVVPRATDLAPKPAPQAQEAALPERAVSPELQKPEDEIVLDVTAYRLPATAPEKLRQALAAITAPYVGKGKTWEDLVNAKDAVARYLQSELGYYLGYAYIPAQKAAGGVVDIAILEGRLDRVRLVWGENLAIDRSIVEGYLAQLKPGAILTVAEVERVVFLVNDLRGVNARFEIEPGGQPGTANVIVRVQPEQRFQYRVDADINGSRFIGQERLGAQMLIGNPLGKGDSLSLSALTSYNSGMRFFLAGYNLPVGVSGLRLGGAVSAVRYELDREAFPIGRHGTALNANLFGLYPVIRSRNLNLYGLLAFDEKRYDDREDASQSKTKKTVRSLGLAFNGDVRDNLMGGGVNSYDVGVSGGSVSYDGGRPSGLLDAPNYTKVNGSFARIQNVLTGNLLGYVSLRGQYAFKNLDTTEQFRLGGPDGVRAFANGEGTGDAGFIVTAELRAPLPASVFGRWGRETVVALFYDHGTIYYRHDRDQDTTLAGLENRARYAGYGVSIAWSRPGAYALRASLASPTIGEPKSDTKKPNPRAYLQFSAFF